VSCVSESLDSSFLKKKEKKKKKKNRAAFQVWLARWQDNGGKGIYGCAWQL
jgi:hypothetical protein